MPGRPGGRKAHDRRALEQNAPFQPLAEAALVRIRTLRARREAQKKDTQIDPPSIARQASSYSTLSTFPSASFASSLLFSFLCIPLNLDCFASFLPFYPPSRLLFFFSLLPPQFLRLFRSAFLRPVEKTKKGAFRCHSSGVVSLRLHCRIHCFVLIP